MRVASRTHSGARIRNEVIAISVSGRSTKSSSLSSPRRDAAAAIIVQYISSVKMAQIKTQNYHIENELWPECKSTGRTAEAKVNRKRTSQQNELNGSQRSSISAEITIRMRKIEGTIRTLARVSEETRVDAREEV